MIPHPQLIEFIKQSGPILPNKLVSKFKVPMLLASAQLAELSAQAKVKVSHLKIGGSPLYYLVGQETQLEQYSDSLKEKEKKAYDLLKQHQVVLDEGLSPVARVALQSLVDFAVQLSVTLNNEKVLFWKWHSLSDDQVKEKLRELLQPIQEEKSKVAKPESVLPTSVQESSPKEQAQEPLQEKIPPKEHIQENDPKEAVTPEPKTPVEDSEEDSEYYEDDESVEEEETQVSAPLESLQSETFEEALDEFFTYHNIKIIDKSVKRKNAEIDFVLDIPSALGRLRYYCKAKNKKRINDGDISSTLVQGQIKKLPPVLLTPGQLSKKAQELLDSDIHVTVSELPWESA